MVRLTDSKTLHTKDHRGTQMHPVGERGQTKVTFPTDYLFLAHTRL